MLSYEVLEKASSCLKVIAHPVRLRMIELLLENEYTVGDLAELCEVKQNVASEHLRLMQNCGLMCSERRGRKVFYQVAQVHLSLILDCIRNHIK